jgi:hypothetical protein
VTFGFLMSQAQVTTTSIDWDAIRTVITALTAAGVIGTIKLLVSMRDTMRDLKNEVGSSADKGSLIARVDHLEGEVDGIRDRNRGIDLVMKQYVRDMRKLDNGGGQRASDRALQEAVELAFTEPSEGRTQS